MKPISYYIKHPQRALAPVFIKTCGLMPDKLYLQILYLLKMGKVLHLKNPQTYSEKLQWLKLYNRKPEFTKMVDKYTGKDYVASIIDSDYIIPTLGVWNTPEEINWDELPEKFVLKTTHGGGSVGVVICRNKDTFEKSKAIKNLKKSLKQDIYRDLREWPYKNVKKRIIAEPLLENGGVDTQDLMDYKFFCFNGDPKYCQVILGRSKRMSIDFFDKEWRHQDFHEPKNYPFANIDIIAPSSYGLMLDLASRLSKGHPFLRVDFYEVNGHPLIGELTFFPTSGFGGFDPEEWDYIFGSWIELPNVIKR